MAAQARKGTSVLARGHMHADTYAGGVGKGTGAPMKSSEQNVHLLLRGAMQCKRPHTRLSILGWADEIVCPAHGNRSSLSIV